MTDLIVTFTTPSSGGKVARAARILMGASASLAARSSDSGINMDRLDIEAEYTALLALKDTINRILAFIDEDAKS